MQAIINDLSYNSNVQEFEVSKNNQTQSTEPKISFEALISQANEINKIELDSQKDINQSTAPVQESKSEEPKAKETVKEEKKEVSEDKTSEKKVESKEEPKEIDEEEKVPVEMNISQAVVVPVEEEKEVQISDELSASIAVEDIEIDENTAALAALQNQEELQQNIPEINTKNLNKSDENNKLSIDSDKLNVKSSSDNDENISNLKNQNTKLEKSAEKTNKLDKDSKITVKDLRTEKVEEKVDDKKPVQKLNVDVKMNNSNTATITMEYANQQSEENLLSLNNQTAASEGSNFQAMLNNQIQQNVPEFVKAGSVILKDNNQGTINLLLRPDNLGNVKIHLSLDGKTINGSIVVATKEAMEVFKDNAQTLREAFIESGFEGADFNVSYNNNNNGNNGQEFSNQFDDGNFLAKKIYGNNSSASGEVDTQLNELISSKNDNYSINIVA